MYVSSVHIRDLRSCADVTLEFQVPGKSSPETLKEGFLPNANIVVGPNGSGKTTILKALALLSFGPTLHGSGLRPYAMIRRASGVRRAEIDGLISESGKGELSNVLIVGKGELEYFVTGGGGDPADDPRFQSDNERYFCAGCGANRRVELPETFDPSARQQAYFARTLRVLGLFQESHSLVPLVSWLPRVKPSRREEIRGLLNRLADGGNYRLEEDMEESDYVFSDGKISVPFQALSDGYRAFFGWISDFIYHLHVATPMDQALTETPGLVLVDEVDLHLHPAWQMRVVRTMCEAFPKIQFVFTTHSPLVASSVHRRNLHALDRDDDGWTRVLKIEDGVHGMDADQVLLSPLFGLQTSRVGSKPKRLKELSDKAIEGDLDAARLLMAELAKGDA